MAKGARFTELTSLHKEGHDPALCAESVFASGMWNSHQCSRYRGYGPEQAYCRQHSPEAKAERKDKWRAKYDADRAEWQRKRAREDIKNEMVGVMLAIAEGHNDPRAIAEEIIARWNCVGED